jgi:hypothetical protein
MVSLDDEMMERGTSMLAGKKSQTQWRQYREW